MAAPASPTPQRFIPFAEFYRGRVARTTALRWAERGRLRTFKVGGRLYTDITFDEFVERCAEAAE
jgi:hypothetical protein